MLAVRVEWTTEREKQMGDLRELRVGVQRRSSRDSHLHLIPTFYPASVRISNPHNGPRVEYASEALSRQTRPKSRRYLVRTSTAHGRMRVEVVDKELVTSEMFTTGLPKGQRVVMQGVED
jgi:hypothetical protein